METEIKCDKTKIIIYNKLLALQNVAVVLKSISYYEDKHQINKTKDNRNREKIRRRIVWNIQ